MKYFTSAFLFILFISCFNTCLAGTKVVPLDTLLNDGNEWKLAFEDNFSSNSLDLSKWKLSESSQIQSGTDEPDDETVFPAFLDIDYVRYYKRN
jgi:hypothetical protein